MAVNWPSTLPQQPSGYSQQDKPIVIRTQPDSGPTKSRKRFTKSVTKAKMDFVFTIAQWQVFDAFFRNDLGSGSIQMNFIHPWTGISKVMSITDEPSSDADGPLAVKVSFPVEFF